LTLTFRLSALRPNELSNETFEEWNRETGAKRPQERVRLKTKSAKVSGKRSATKRTRPRVVDASCQALIPTEAPVRVKPPLLNMHQAVDYLGLHYVLQG
jgi:hypothetical protein